MRITPSQGAFGIEITEFNPATGSGEDIAALRELLRKHRVLVFRNVRISQSQHVAFMAQFGRIMIEVNDPAALADPTRLGGRVSYVTTRPGEYISGRGSLGFHADFSWSADGAEAVFSLYALEADREDPTIFADMGLALRRLSKPMRDRLRDLELVKCVNFYHNASEEFGPRYRLSHRDPDKDYGPTISVHPAIVRHPETGEEILNTCQTFTSHIKGWSYAESDRLFAELEPEQYAEECPSSEHLAQLAA